MHRLFDFLVRLVLAEGVDRPDCGGNPADDRNLKKQADDAGNGSANGEKLKPGEKESEKEAHVDGLYAKC